MIHWLAPWALWGLAAIAAPIAIHLLRREKAPRITFPSLRFVSSAARAPARPRTVSDLVLLAIRVAIVVCAAVAAAQPVVVTARRTAAWNGRIARVVIVDTSESTRSAPVEPLVSAERLEAAIIRQIDTADVASAMHDAAAWLRSAPPARREIVVISDFQEGAIRPADVTAVPDPIGLRFVQVETPTKTREVPLRFYDGSSTRVVAARLEGAATVFTGAAQADGVSGLRFVVSEAEKTSVARLQRVVAAAGAAAPSEGEPIAFVFAGATPPAAEIPRQPWMIAALLRLRQDSELRALGARPGSDVVRERWVDVLHDASARPLVRAAASGNELIVVVERPSADLFAAATVRAALNARVAPPPPEQEVLTLPAAQLTHWSRQPADASGDGWQRVERSDARWFWILALVLLGIEHMVRRSPRSAVRAEEAHAA